MSRPKGPWTARTNYDEPHVVEIYQDDQGRRCTGFVAVCNSSTLPNADNARLIAAAPDLLAALREYDAFHQEQFVTGRPLQIDGVSIDHTRLNHAHQLAQAAIAKAENES